MTAPNMLSAALYYAGAGVKVFPVNGKAPLTEHGFHDATTDRKQVEAWWSQNPNAGIATADFDVVDVDLYKPECTETWKRIRPLIPEGTPQNKTARGGLQFIFAPKTLQEGKIGPGIDKRYAGRNYILLPPSQALGGRYETVVDVLLKHPKPAPEFPHVTNGAAPPIEDVILEGERDDTLTSLAGTMRRRGMSKAEILAALTVTNEQRCKPPYPRGDLERIARSVARYEPAANSTSTKPGTPPRRLTATRLSDIEMRSIEWLDRPLWQRSAFHLLVGRKGVGKGTYLAMLMAKMTRGELYGHPMNALVISTEDSASIDVKPRVIAAGGNDQRIHVVNEHLKLPDDIEALRDLALEIGDVGMLVIDPIGNHTMRAKTGDDGEIRHAISQLNGLADELRCLIPGVRHLGKNTEADALDRVLGSVAWVDVPRAVIGVAADDEDDMTFHMQVIAGNRGPSGEQTVRTWRMDLVQLDGLTEPVTKAVELGESAKNVEDLLTSRRATTSSAKARELILDILESADDMSVESDTLDARVAQETGLAARTVQNLRKELSGKGLVKPVPERKDESGAVKRWLVKRTAAPRD